MEIWIAHMKKLISATLKETSKQPVSQLKKEQNSQNYWTLDILIPLENYIQRKSNTGITCITIVNKFISFWSYRSGARKTNKGWRLDYFICDDSMFPAVEDSKIISDIMGSDHCPLELDIILGKMWDKNWLKLKIKNFT